LAEGFLDLGCSVVLSGRTQTGADAAREKLAKSHGIERVTAFQCDVTDRNQVLGLWNRAWTSFGRIDMWVNNAGLSNLQAKIWQVPEVQMAAVVDTNLMRHPRITVAVRGCWVKATELYTMLKVWEVMALHEWLVVWNTKYAELLYKSLTNELKYSP
jgi:NAD(P)-dependent dehydrogenase (short-subunit alcohol dehydrogenase family)